jgi:hypothetical protein
MREELRQVTASLSADSIFLKEKARWHNPGDLINIAKNRLELLEFG